MFVWTDFLLRQLVTHVDRFVLLQTIETKQRKRCNPNKNSYCITYITDHTNLHNESSIDFIEFTMFQITGCGLLGVGIWLRVSYEGYTSLLPQYSLMSADALLIGIGAVSFVLAFFGCCGSWFQSKCLLITVRNQECNKNQIKLIFFCII